MAAAEDLDPRPDTSAPAARPKYYTVPQRDSRDHSHHRRDGASKIRSHLVYEFIPDSRSLAQPARPASYDSLSYDSHQASRLTDRIRRMRAPLQRISVASLTAASAVLRTTIVTVRQLVTLSFAASSSLVLRTLTGARTLRERSVAGGQRIADLTVSMATTLSGGALTAARATRRGVANGTRLILALVSAIVLGILSGVSGVLGGVRAGATALARATVIVARRVADVTVARAKTLSGAALTAARETRRSAARAGRLSAALVSAFLLVIASGVRRRARASAGAVARGTAHAGPWIGTAASATVSGVAGVAGAVSDGVQALLQVGARLASHTAAAAASRLGRSSTARFRVPQWPLAHWRQGVAVLIGGMAILAVIETSRKSDGSILQTGNERTTAEPTPIPIPPVNPTAMAAPALAVASVEAAAAAPAPVDIPARRTVQTQSVRTNTPVPSRARASTVAVPVRRPSRPSPPPAVPRRPTPPRGERGAVATGGTTVFTGALTISSNPPGATVFVDGKSFGATPVSARELRAGSHVVRIDLDGYERWSASVHVVTDKNVDVSARLQPGR